MKLFRCQNCDQVIHFENDTCLGCGAALGFLPERAALSALAPAVAGLWTAAAEPGRLWRACANRAGAGCNWMLPAENPAEDQTGDPADGAGDSAGGGALCPACRHNRTIPDLSAPGNLALWQRIEGAKRRLFYSLIRLGLPHPAPGEGHPQPLVFDILAETGDEPVLTGHASGTITLALAEAEDAERERRRANLGEGYRTLLGHFRHEIGHYYWDLLLRDGGEVRLQAFRGVFGDERADYAAALDRHYREGAPPGWEAEYISAYATAHPWEDWAETWAHYLHMVDTLEMAGALGLRLAPRADRAGVLAAEVAGDPYRAASLSELIEAWRPVSVGLNALNRAMGLPDPYPFAPGSGVEAKLGFVHDLLQGELRQRGNA